MGIFDYYPYTNIHELNLDWIVRALKENLEAMDNLSGEFSNYKDEIAKLLASKIYDDINNYINENLSQFILGAVYVADTNTIILQESE